MNLRERLAFTLAEDPRMPPARGSFEALYEHAFQNVPHYRKKFEAAGLSGCGPADIRSIPPLTKEELSDGLNVCPGRSFAVALESGGTTGRKAVSRLGWDYLVKRYSMLLRVLYSLGWEMGRPVSALHPVEYGYWNNLPEMLGRGEVGRAAFEFVQQYLVYRLLHNRSNSYYSRAAFEGGATSDALAVALRRRPFLLIGRPDIMGCLVKRSGADLSGSVSAALVVGNLTVGAALKRLGCRAFNMYASTEAGYVGLSCAHSREWVHVDDADYLVETDPDQEHEVIVTDLNNYGAPLIRYRTGDVGELAVRSCPCGRTGPLLRIRGRKGRYLEDRRGSRSCEAEVMEYFEGFPELWAYQVVVGPGREVSVRLRSRGPLDHILDGFCARFGPARGGADSPLTVSPSGKLPCIVRPV